MNLAAILLLDAKCCVSPKRYLGRYLSCNDLGAGQGDVSSCLKADIAGIGGSSP